MTRWPRKPPPGTRCDAGRGVSSDYAGKPVVLRCENDAVETVKGVFGFETWLCTECAEHLAVKERVKRNPRLHKDDRKTDA